MRPKLECFTFNHNKKNKRWTLIVFLRMHWAWYLHRRLPLRVHRPRWPTMRGGIKDGMHKTEHRKYVRKGNTSINWLNPQLLLVHEWPNSPTVVHWPTRICDRFGMLFLELTGQPRSLLTKNLWSPFHGWYEKEADSKKASQEATDADSLQFILISPHFIYPPFLLATYTCV